MRKVTFFIDDLAFFKDEAPDVDFGDQKSFKAVYTLYGEGKNIDRYKLESVDGVIIGAKIPLDTLNGYQRGVILNDCKAYFEGRSYTNNGTKPCGVVKIVDNGLVLEMIGEQKQYLTPKARIREDIANAMRVSNTFEEYKTVMTNNGYELREGNSQEHGHFITYTAPNGQKIRDYILGENYTYNAVVSNFTKENKPSLNDVINEAKEYNAYESARKAFKVREELIQSGVLKVKNNYSPER